MSKKTELSEAARQWKDFTTRLGDVGLRVHEIADGERTVRQHGEINQALLWSLSAGALYLAHMDPDHPDFLPQGNSAYLYLCTSPDNAYYLTRIRGSGVYRIRGKRGSVRRIDLTLQNGFIGFTEHSPTLEDIDIDDLKIAPDGTFEIILGATRPADSTANFIKLDPAIDDVFIFIRQISYDWRNEEDGHLTIQRIDRPIGQASRRDSINARLAEVSDYVEKIAMTLMALISKQYPEDHEINRVEDITPKIGDQSIIAGQFYYAGELVLGPDDALIIEFENPTSCSYWNTQLVDSFFNALDFTFHQTELNSERIHVDPDGRIRIVVSQKDPGVPNWMDKGDYERNVIRFRWYRGAAPKTTSRKVPFSEVGNHLHPATPKISPEERQAALRQRVELIQRRRRW